MYGCIYCGGLLILAISCNPLTRLVFEPGENDLMFDMLPRVNEKSFEQNEETPNLQPLGAFGMPLSVIKLQKMNLRVPISDLLQ